MTRPNAPPCTRCGFYEQDQGTTSAPSLGLYLPCKTGDDHATTSIGQCCVCRWRDVEIDETDRCDRCYGKEMRL